MRILVILLAGVLLFALQLLYAASVQQSVLTAKSAQIAMQTLSGVLQSPDGLAWVAYYLGLGVLLHAMFVALAVGAHARLVGICPRLDARGLRVLMVALLFLALTLINGWYFPNAAMRVQILGDAGPWVGMAILCVYFLLVVIRSRVLASVVTVGCVIFAANVSGVLAFGAKGVRDRPDVIIIGIDSLRHDHVHKLEDGLPLIPAISRFANQAVEFERAYTPMARTYVAYTSLLTGKYPVHHGVRENLYPQQLLDRSWLLPEQLSSMGYAAVLAMDESRFANLDAGFGFSVNALPPSSGLDFVLAGSMDTVATNFLHLVPGGWRLMPHVAGNRAGHTAYSPKVHSNRVISAVKGVGEGAPLFLLSHYCVAHSPFWQGAVGAVTDSLPEYAAALKVVDAQVEALLQALDDSGRLNNAIVILISDHGEGLGLEVDAVEDAKGGRRSHFGHGYPVYDLKQSHILMAMQRYVDGVPMLPAGKDPRLTSLVDVAPTVMALLGDGATSSDGVPLFWGRNPAGDSERYVYVESGIFGPSLQKRSVNPGEVVEEFAGMYHLGKDGRFVVTDATISHLKGFKQRMAISASDMYVWLPGCESHGCLQHYDPNARKLSAVEEPSSAVHALCPLYGQELGGLCQPGAAGALH